MVNIKIKLIIFFAAEMEKLYIVSKKKKKKERERLGADCVSDHKFLIVKLFRYMDLLVYTHYWVSI